MNYIVYTLGCKVNQYESQAVASLLEERGFSEGEPADVVIVNTCAVTAESGRKSRQAIRKLRDEHPGALIAVCGCYSQLSPQDVEQLDAGIIYGTNDKASFVDAIVAGVDRIDVDEPFKRHGFEILPSGAVDGRTRAMLKIQDGCVNFCSYCIIPYTRGRLRSLPIDEAVSQSVALMEKGFRELVLTGIEIASYGIDLEGKPDLSDIVCAVAESVPSVRIRLGSIEPTVITEEFCRRLSSYDNICRHFHLALQSGCDVTLKAMNRKYDTARFYESCCLLRKYFPGCAITCDMITGFPGETDEDFSSTLDFIRKCEFSAMHIFPYSRRPGTPADKMPHQCTNAVKTDRAKKAAAVAAKMHDDYLAQSIGKVLPVLFETEENGYWSGHSDTYIVCNARGDSLRNKIINVRIEYSDGGQLYGTCI